MLFKTAKVSSKIRYCFENLNNKKFESFKFVIFERFEDLEEFWKF